MDYDDIVKRGEFLHAHNGDDFSRDAAEAIRTLQQERDEAVEALDMLVNGHIFMASDNDSNTCQKCGSDFRHEHHYRNLDGGRSALSDARAILAKHGDNS